MVFLYNHTLIIGFFIFVICFVIGYYGDKRMKNKSKKVEKEEIVISKKEQSSNNFSLPDDEWVNNMF